MNPKVILKSGKEKSILRRHPWVFSGAVYGVTEELEDGQLVDVVDNNQKHLGTGFFSDRGSIVVRLLTFGKEQFTENFWVEKLQSAWELRTKLLNLNETDAFRVIHGEGDGIPGLIIDFYNNCWVIQAHSSGISKSRQSQRQMVALGGCRSRGLDDATLCLLATHGVAQRIDGAGSGKFKH